MRKIYGGRFFLNSPGHETTAVILAECEDTSDWKPGCNRKGKPIQTDNWDFYPHMLFEMSDCSGKISLNFNFHSKSSRANSVEKARIIAETAQAFYEGIKREAELYAERDKIRRKNAKKLKKAYKKNPKPTGETPNG